ncbi:trypsin-like serine protease, partial [Linnemannia elongata AG-77]
RAMSGKCNLDVACHLDEYHDQSRSVGAILSEYNQKYCSGALINNVRQDGRQLFLTANHCSGFTDTSAHLVMFNHEKIQCGSTPEEVNEHDTAMGLIKLGSYLNSDYTLYEIVETIPDAYNLYLSGWSALPEAPMNPSITKIPIFGIHHPSGDSKKISFFYNGTLPPVCWSECMYNEKFHWQIPRWDQGTTEPGSSGSPLFNADKRIVGQLHGGSASCYNRNGYDVYGAIFASFSSPPKIKNRLATYLDPEGTGAKFLDGYGLEQARRESRQ